MLSKVTIVDASNMKRDAVVVPSNGLGTCHSINGMAKNVAKDALANICFLAPRKVVSGRNL